MYKRPLNSVKFANLLKEHFSKFIFDNNLDFKVPPLAYKISSTSGEKVVGFITGEYKLHSKWETNHFEIGNPNLIPMLEDLLRHYYDI